MSLSYGFALRPADSSADFSDAFHAVIGDGIASQGGQFSLTVNGFTVKLSSGYAFAAGRWLENDEPLALSVPASGSSDDRTDALVVRVDHPARKAALELLPDVDPDKLPDALRSGEDYSIVLYLIRVPRGASSLTPEQVTDCRSSPELCGSVVPLSAIAGDVLRVYAFLQGGIDAEVDRVIALSQAVVDKASQGIAQISAELKRVGGGPELGELRTARLAPVPAERWLLCDGGPVPAAYPALSALLDGTLPDISRPEDRYRTYIYGGE